MLKSSDIGARYKLVLGTNITILALALVPYYDTIVPVMLTLFTRSNIVLELLGVFFHNPSSRFYLREIERLTKKPVGTIQRHLSKLEGDGILKSELKANLKFFSLNTDYPYFSELQSVVLKELRRAKLENNLKALLRALKKDYHPEKIILFGSMASGKISPDTDIDILVIKSGLPKRYLDRTKQLAPFISGRDVGVDIVAWTPAEFELEATENLFLQNEIIKKGKVLYDRAA